MKAEFRLLGGLVNCQLSPMFGVALYVQVTAFVPFCTVPVGVPELLKVVSTSVVDAIPFDVMT